MDDVVVGSAEAVLAEVHEVVEALIAPAAAGVDRLAQFPAPTSGVLRTWTGKALAGLPVP